MHKGCHKTRLTHNVGIDVLTTSQGAEQLGMSRQRVLQFCQSGELDAIDTGGVWLIDADSLRRRELLGRLGALGTGRLPTLHLGHELQSLGTPTVRSQQDAVSAPPRTSPGLDHGGGDGASRGTRRGGLGRARSPPDPVVVPWSSQNRQQRFLYFRFKPHEHACASHAALKLMV